MEQSIWFDNYSSLGGKQLARLPIFSLAVQSFVGNSLPIPCNNIAYMEFLLLLNFFKKTAQPTTLTQFTQFMTDI